MPENGHFESVLYLVIFCIEVAARLKMDTLKVLELITFIILLSHDWSINTFYNHKHPSYHKY